LQHGIAYQVLTAMAALFLALLLAGGHAFRYEQLEDEDVLPRLRAFDASLRPMRHSQKYLISGESG